MAELSPIDRDRTAISGERQLAALDLGSNSFHMLVAQESNGRLQVVDRIKEMVRLADGLSDNKTLSDDVMQRALECLDRFSQRLRGLDPDDIRVVGTNTLRRATNARQFLEEAERILGKEVEIISGREEARLIYLGVSHALEDTADRRLVVDIGGGSTEIILGRRFRAEVMESLYMGCVGMTQRCFADGKLRSGQFKEAINLARQELEPLEQVYKEAGWDIAIGASGTILAVQDILTQLSPDSSAITLEGLTRIRLSTVHAPDASRGYRTADFAVGPFEADMHPTQHPDSPERERLLSLTKAYFHARDLDPDLEGAFEAPYDALVTSLAMSAPFQPGEKQALLECATNDERARMLISLFEMAVESGMDGGSTH